MFSSKLIQLSTGEGIDPREVVAVIPGDAKPRIICRGIPAFYGGMKPGETVADAVKRIVEEVNAGRGTFLGQPGSQ